MKTFIKLLFLVVILLNFNVNSFAGVIENDCSKIKNIYKKMVCKTNKATSGITSKKNLTDFFKKNKK